MNTYKKNTKPLICNVMHDLNGIKYYIKNNLIMSDYLEIYIINYIIQYNCIILYMNKFILIYIII